MLLYSIYVCCYAVYIYAVIQYIFMPLYSIFLCCYTVYTCLQTSYVLKLKVIMSNKIYKTLCPKLLNFHVI